MITIFTLMNSFFFFFLQKVDNLFGLKTLVLERWLIHMKRLVAARALLVLLRVLFMIHCTTAQIEEVRKSLGG